MIPLTILFIIRKLKIKMILIGIIRNFLKSIPKVAMAVFSMLFFVAMVLSPESDDSNQKQTLEFNVFKNNRLIGEISITKQNNGTTVVYNLDSKLQAKFFMGVEIVGREKAVFRNGVLVYSSIYRSLNNKVQVDKEITFGNDSYLAIENRENIRSSLDDIKENLVGLYFKEPKGANEVYCDNQNEMVPVEAVSKGVYKVRFSATKYNTFHYDNGACSMVEAVGPMFSVTIIPAKS